MVAVSLASMFWSSFVRPGGEANAEDVSLAYQRLHLAYAAHVALPAGEVGDALTAGPLCVPAQLTYGWVTVQRGGR